MRIVIGNIVQESNSFSPVPGSWDHFPPGHLLRGDDVIAQRAGTRTEVGGAIDVASAQDITLVPLVSATTSAPARPPVRSALSRCLRCGSSGFPAPRQRTGRDW